MLFYMHFGCLISIPSAFDSSYYLEQIRWMIIRLDDIINLWIKNWQRFHAWNKEARWKKRDNMFCIMRSGLCVKLNLQWMLKNAVVHMPSRPPILSQSEWEIFQGEMVLQGGELFLWVFFFFFVFFVEEVCGGQAECHVYKSSEQTRYKVVEGEWKMCFSISCCAYMPAHNFVQKYTFSQCFSTYHIYSFNLYIKVLV